MSNLSFPSVTPTRSTFDYEAGSIVHTSFLTSFVQAQSFGAEHWRCTLFFENLSPDDRAELIGWIAKLNGMQNRALIPIHGITQQGNFGGTPVVDGASQAGIQLNARNASTTITDWAKRGDYFSINNELKIMTDDADSDGSGDVVLNFRPRIRQSPDDGDSIEVSNPIGKFILATSAVQWSYRPGGFTDLQISFVEDVLT